MMNTPIQKHWFIGVATLCLCGLFLQPLNGQQVEEPEEIRTLFVPFDDVHQLLQGQSERVFMSWDEYQALKRGAKETETISAPRPTAMLSGQFRGSILLGEASFQGELELEVLEPGLHEITLPLQGMQLRQAKLDGEGAPLVRDGNGQVRLLVRGVGRHKLELLLTQIVDVSTAQQSLQFELPYASTNELQLTVPGNVEIKSGGDVISRSYDEENNRTSFELVPQRSMQTLVMSLNNKRQRDEQLVVARSVIMSELTQAYERIHGTLSYDVTLGAVQELSVEVPTGFQVTHVEAEGLDRWQVDTTNEAEEENAPTLLQLFLREPTQQSIRVQLTAIRTGTQTDQWQMPQVKPLNVAASVAVLGVVAETRLTPQRLESTGLLPLNSDVLIKALPPSVLASEPGEPTIRPIAAFYATGTDYTLQAKLSLPAEKLSVSSHSLLTIQRRQLELEGGFVLTPNAEKLQHFAFLLDQQWRVDRVQNSAGTSLQFNRTIQDGMQRFHVVLPQAVAVDQSETIIFHATRQSSEWLNEWTTFDLSYPRIELVDAELTQGALAIRALDDLTFRVTDSNELQPLDSSQRAEFGLGAETEDVAFEFAAADYLLNLVVEPNRSWISCRNYSFFTIEDMVLRARYEVVFEVTGAGIDEVELQLPESTPQTLLIRGADGVEVKESQLTQEDNLHRWSVRLNKRTKGRFRLMAEFEQPLSNDENVRIDLPLIRANGVSYQNEMVAIEGDPNRDIEIETEMRLVDIGELSEANYLPGPRLLGAYDAIDGQASIAVVASPRELRPLPPAIVERAELVSAISTTGRNQTAARYHLKTKLSYLEVELPENSILWGMLLDGVPLKPQRRGDSVLVELQLNNQSRLLNLQVVYEVPVESIEVLGRIRATAPKLLLKSESDGEATEVPQADLYWTVFLPTGYEVIETHGTVFLKETAEVKSPVQRLAMASSTLGGGVHTGWSDSAVQVASSMFPMEAVEANREADATVSMPMDGLSDDEYASAMEGEVLGGEYFDSSEAAPSSGLASPSSARQSSSSRSELSREGAANEMAQVNGRPSGDGSGNPYPSNQSSYGRTGVYPPGQAGSSSGARGGAPGEAPGYSFDIQGRSRDGLGGAGFGPPGGGGSQPQAEEADLAGQALSPVDPAESVGKYWALQGLGSLKIDIETNGPSVQFSSVGEQPVLDATVLHRPRLTAVSWAIAFAVFVGGVLLDRFGLGIKLTYVALVVVGALSLPLLGGMWMEVADAFDLTLIAGLALIPWYLLVATIANFRKLFSRPAAAAILVVGIALGVLGGPTETFAALQAEVDPFSNQANINQSGTLTIPKVRLDKDDDRTPIQVPDNALVIPFDPAVIGKPEIKEVLVPYAEYRRLWNLAFPDQKQPEKPVVPYAIAGARYETKLGSNNSLVVTGVVELEVFESTDSVDIPLSLKNAVITSATLNGKPASLRAFVVNDQPNATPQQQNVQPAANPVVGLTIDQPGRHRLVLELQIARNQQGGWQMFDWVMPTAPATELEILVPESGTQIRIEQERDQRVRLTENVDETISVVPNAMGQVRFAWRPKLDEGMVDQSLTVQSTAVLDVLETGLKLHWQLNYSFGRNERSQLRFEIPSDLQVEAVKGDNVRGWDIAEIDGKTVVDVQLLKAVRQQESIVVTASKRGEDALAGPANLSVPKVEVSEAVLHRGAIVIRRSPVLELRTVSSSQVSRTEIQNSVDPSFAASADSETPLGIVPFQGFQFNSAGFSIQLERIPVVRELVATHQSIWRVGETESTLEAKLQITPTEIGIQQIGIEIPADLELDTVLMAGDYDWSIDEVETEAGAIRVLRLFSSQLLSSQFDVQLKGELAEHQPDATLSLPQLKVQNAKQQSGVLLIQSDASLDVSERNLENAETIPLEQTYGWLSVQQRPVSRLAIRCRNQDYAGELQLRPKTAVVTCDTVTNIRVTYRAIETTLLLDFTISQAGVRTLQFKIPTSLASARIMAKMVRSQEISEVADEPGVSLVTISLQDAVMGQYRVVIQHDRELSLQEQSVPVPELVTGETNLQFLTLQNAGRDELVVNDSSGFEPLERDQRQWQTLVAKLQGGDYTMAYRLRNRSEAASFRFASKRRQLVQTSGARIGLAETMLIVDNAGGYRAAQIYRIDNRTEPFLEIELPDSATLWTAVVAGTPVKPAVFKGGNDNLVRIPIVKTSEGDLDYQIILKYGGRMKGMEGFGPVQFPLMKTVNINVELSQLQLWLPVDRQWFDFDGSAIQVEDEAELLAGYLEYETQQVERLTEALQSNNTFSKTRAAGNLKNLEQQLEKFSDRSAFANDNYRNNVDSNKLALENATRQIAKTEAELVERTDNRDQLTLFFESQSNGLSSNSVNRLGSNFNRGVQIAGPTNETANFQFNDRWLSSNGLLLENSISNDQAGGQFDNFESGSRLQNRLGRDTKSKKIDGQQQAEGFYRGRLAEDQPDQAEATSGQQPASGENLNRQYEQKLAQQQSGQQLGQNDSEFRFGIVGGVNADSDSDVLTPSEFDDRGFASLDIELPHRGKRYMFVTPRGAVDMTARSVDARTVERSTDAAWLIGLLVVAGAVCLVLRRLTHSLVAMGLLAAVAIVVGGVLLLSGHWPLLGLFSWLCAGFFVIRAIQVSRRQRQTASDPEQAVQPTS